MAETKRKATTRPDSRRGMTKGQIREERRDRSRARARRKRSILTFAGVLFAIVFITALVVPRNTDTSTGGGVNSGGHIALDADDGRGHIENNTDRGGPYSVVPATSGAHWFGANTAAAVSSPARWGRYVEALPDEVLVHNLEHGGIGFHYDCEEECPDIVKALDDLIPRGSIQYIMSPYAGMPSKIAITAWRHHLYLDEVDVEQIRRFIDEYQDRAPESVQGNSF
ncbi:MAG: DUF3105 domain-containing protein [Chloroflexi bacterium]|jgi:hypothetical protein|nr:DUF3105 domain-containing protein [Chloroflexota bacterium]MBT5627678.1 DUF3105 domain-containing protein [Chloroflexota bacterium]